MLIVLAVFISITACKTYDQSYDWVEGSDIEGVTLSANGISRGIVEFSLTNNGTQDQTVVVLPQTTIIGYQKYLNRITNKANKPGQFKGEPHFVRPSHGSFYRESGIPNINGSFSLSSNDIMISPGETVYTQLFLNNWDRATENFIVRIYFLVREGEVRNRIVLDLPAESFFNTSSFQEGSGSQLRFSSSIRISN